MKIAPVGILVLLMALLGNCHEALALQPGQSIGISFGATVPDNHFNQCNPANPDIVLTGSLSAVIDTTGATLPGVGLKFSGENVLSSQDGTLLDFSNYSGFSASNIQNGVVGDSLSISFTGLDMSQTFTFDLVSAYASRNIGTEFFWNGTSILTDSTSTTGGTLAHFTDVVPDKNGTITITALGHDQFHAPSWAGINAALLTLQPVPEPSAMMLSLVGAFGLIAGKRLRLLINRSHRRW